MTKKRRATIYVLGIFFDSFVTIFGIYSIIIGSDLIGVFMTVCGATLTIFDVLSIRGLFNE